MPSITNMEAIQQEDKLPSNEGEELHTPKKNNSNPDQKNKSRGQSSTPISRELREQEKEFIMVARKVMLTVQGDPKFNALATPGGMSLRRMAPKLYDKPPEICKELMGGNEDGCEVSDEEWKELTIFMSYLTYAWNQWGNQDHDFIDYSTLTREGFVTFLTMHYVPGIWNYYDQEEATKNGRRRREREADEEKLRRESEAHARKLRKDEENADKIREIERSSAEASVAASKASRSASKVSHRSEKKDKKNQSPGRKANSIPSAMP